MLHIFFTKKSPTHRVSRTLRMDGAPCRSQKPTREFTNSNSLQSTNSIIHAPNAKFQKENHKTNKIRRHQKRGKAQPWSHPQFTNQRKRGNTTRRPKASSEQSSREPRGMKLEFVQYLSPRLKNLQNAPQQNFEWGISRPTNGTKPRRNSRQTQNRGFKTSQTHKN